MPSTPETVSWGWMPSAADGPVLEVAPGGVVCVDTVSHEGILGDQGRDPVGFFGGFGVPESAVLTDAAAIATSALPHDPAADGPHVVTGPIAVTGARPGDVVSITVLDLVPRVPYGIVSTRHGLGALPGEVIGDDAVFSAFCLIEDGAGTIALRADDPDRRARFPLAPFLGFMGVAEQERVHSVAPGRHGGNIDVTAARGRARRCTCRSRCPARWSGSATRTSPRATARSRSRRSRHRCAPPCGWTSCPPTRSPSGSGR